MRLSSSEDTGNFTPQVPRAHRSLDVVNLRNQYQKELADYLRSEGEGSLHAVYELGRLALSQGVGLLEIVDAHEQGLIAILFGKDKQNDHQSLLIKRATRFLEEALSPFEISRLNRENTMLAHRGLYQVMEEESKRVAQLLHDDVAQILAVVYLELAEFSREMPQSVSERIARLVKLLDKVREQLRSLSHEMRPLALDHLGLLPALQLLTTGISNRSDLKIEIHSTIRRRLPQSVATVLYRTMQEGLENIVRHAHASEAVIHLWIKHHTVYGVLSDNGVGFDTSRRPFQDSDGLGLLGIHERVASLGGTYKLISEPGKGTQLYVAIPL